jgi:hypothetical protein
MVVRINQLVLSEPPDAAGWPVHDLVGPIRFRWPKDFQLYEVLILEQDEDRRRLGEDFRQQQLRTLIPAAAEALLEEGEQLVVRLDGVLAKRELAGALNRLIVSEEASRYVVSDIRKLDEDLPAVAASIRVHPTLAWISNLCADDGVGLERTVRLRAFAVPEALVNPLLDVDSVQDERWVEILPQCGFTLSTTMGLKSLQVLTRRHDAVAVKARLTQRLLSPRPRAVGV